MHSPVQTAVQVQEDEKVEEASVQAEVEAAVEAFKLAEHQASYLWMLHPWIFSS